jgi:very-short-patch-repair endonuclease
MIVGRGYPQDQNGVGGRGSVSRVDMNDGLVTLEQALAHGRSAGEVREAVTSGHWVRVARSVYLMRESGSRLSARTAVRANVLSLGPAAVAVYDTAAAIHGTAGLPRSDVIHFSLPAEAARRRVDPRVVVHQLRLSPQEVCNIAGINVTSPLRTVTDLICRNERLTAVSVLDSALNWRLLQFEELAAIPALVWGRRGAVAAREHLREADGRAASPLETRMRLRCVDGGVAPDELQYLIQDANGDLLGIADAAWPRARVVAEADGHAPHSTPAAIFADRRRQNLLARAGWTVLRFTWEDTLRPEYIPMTVRAALNRTR